MPGIILCGLLLLCIILQVRTIRRESPVRLLMPNKIYAAPGIECNIFFDNIVTVINFCAYAYEVNCEAGRNDAVRWRFSSGEDEAGKEYDWTVSVYDGNGLVAKGRTAIPWRRY